MSLKPTFKAYNQNFELKTIKMVLLGYFFD